MADWTKPFVDYWNRWGQHARSGLDMAEQGAQNVQQGDLSGLGGMMLGPVAYVASPLSALVPRGAEENLPAGVQPFARGAMDFVDYFMPGPGELTGPASAVLMGVASKNRNMMQQLPEYLDSEARGAGDKFMHQAHGGWFRDKDLQLKYEIPDTNMKLKPAFIDKLLIDRGSNSSVLEPYWNMVEHPELEDAARDLLQDVRVAINPNDWLSGARGSFNPNSRVLDINVPKPTEGDLNLDEIFSTLAHETEHAIAYSHPNWAGGSNPTYTDAMKFHNPQWREANARAAGSRQNVNAFLMDERDKHREAWNAAMAAREQLSLEDRVRQGLPEFYAHKSNYKQLEALSEKLWNVESDPKALLDAHSIFKTLSDEQQQQALPMFMQLLRDQEAFYRAPYALDTSFDLYQAKLDEVNARTVQERLNFSPEQLMAEAFWETRDRVYPHDKIIPFWDWSAPREQVQRARIQPGHDR